MRSDESSSQLLKIKGLRDGLLVSLADAPWADLENALLTHIDGQESFFDGARLALEVGNQVLHVADLVALRDQLSERGVSLWAIISDSPTTEKTAQLLGLATRVSKPRPEEASHFAVSNIDDETAMWVNRTLRSGVRIEFPGHIVVVGDVNPGAEVIANGSVLVWGRLRGVVHAGAEGNVDSVVCALDLSPTQLRIASEIVLPPKGETGEQPKIASLKDGKLVVEPWQPGA
jgi:septum site-determining protein MinC